MQKFKSLVDEHVKGQFSEFDKTRFNPFHSLKIIV